MDGPSGEVWGNGSVMNVVGSPGLTSCHATLLEPASRRISETSGSWGGPENSIVHARLNISEEIVMKLNSKSGVTLAVAAATLFMAGAAMQTADAQAAKGKCMVGNACKGQSACKGGASACKGQNACKGQGFSMTDAKSCAAAGGKFVAG